MRERSHWGWGFKDRFPDREARTGIAAHASALLGFSAQEVLDPVPLEQIELREPAVAPPGDLVEILSADREDRALHSYGRSYRDVVTGFSGDYRRAPDWVAHPTSEDEIERILEWAGEDQLAVIPYGGGTSVVRGVERPLEGAHRGAISLDLSRLDRVLDLEETSRAARIQAGATGPVLEAQLQARGLTLRHYPQSYEHSTLGGWIATRAGGHYATLRTRIDDFVESVRMISPAGVWQTRRLPASGAGPDPDRIVLGSEGTLGVITEAWVRVSERPRWRARATLHFEHLYRSAEAARRIVQAGLHPANCRILDPLEAELNSVSSSKRAVLILAFESADHAVDVLLGRAIEIARDAGGELPDPPRISGPEGRAEGGEADRWREAFFSAPYLQNVLVSAGVIADTFETACTWDRFQELHAGVIAAVEKALAWSCGVGKVTCRITHVYPDGLAPYFTFLAPAKRGSEISQWTDIKAAASDAILAHGGTITHHHAVGRLHRPWYDRERPELFATALRAVKRALDPLGILNPGVLIDP
jgi:alkyldihydroxyacetonephosphate synthase